MKEFDSAIKLLKAFEKKEYEVRDIAIHFTLAEDYADIAVKTSRYNTKAIVNKGNYFFINIDFTINKEIYLEAIGILADFFK